MPVELTNAQKELQAKARKFAQEYIAPRENEIEEAEGVPNDLWERTVKEGWVGIRMPKQYGGGGAGILDTLLIGEQFNMTHGAVFGVMNCTYLGAYPVQILGTDAQKQKYLTKVVKGSASGVSMSEFTGGSDIAAIQSTAVRKDGYYLVNAHKFYMMNAGISDFYAVWVKTGPPEVRKNLSCFMIDADTPGFKVNRIHGMLGSRATSMGELIFEDAKVPAENLVGVESKGMTVAIKAYEGVGHIGAGGGLGNMTKALKLAMEWAKERVTFEQPLVNHQAVRFLLADAAAKIEACRALSYQAAAMVDAGQEDPVIARSAIYFQNIMSHEIPIKLLEVFGGRPILLREHPMHRISAAALCQAPGGGKNVRLEHVARAMFTGR